MTGILFVCSLLPGRHDELRGRHSSQLSSGPPGHLPSPGVCAVHLVGSHHFPGSTRRLPRAAGPVGASASQGKQAADHLLGVTPPNVCRSHHRDRHGAEERSCMSEYTLTVYLPGSERLTTFNPISYSCRVPECLSHGHSLQGWVVHYYELQLLSQRAHHIPRTMATFKAMLSVPSP